MWSPSMEQSLWIRFCWATENGANERKIKILNILYSLFTSTYQCALLNSIFDTGCVSNSKGIQRVVGVLFVRLGKHAPNHNTPFLNSCWSTMKSTIFASILATAAAFAPASQKAATSALSAHPYENEVGVQAPVSQIQQWPCYRWSRFVRVLFTILCFGCSKRNMPVLKSICCLPNQFAFWQSCLYFFSSSVSSTPSTSWKVFPKKDSILSDTLNWSTDGKW